MQDHEDHDSGRGFEQLVARRGGEDREHQADCAHRHDRQQAIAPLREAPQDVVGDEAGHDGEDDELDNRPHHRAGVDLDVGAGEQRHRQWRQERREHRGNRRQRDRQGDVAAGQIRDDVRGHTPGGGTDEDDAGGHRTREAERHGEQGCERRHDHELQARADQRGFRHLRDTCEITQAERRAHPEHDDLDQQGHQARRGAPGPLPERLRPDHGRRNEREDPEREGERGEAT